MRVHDLKLTGASSSETQRAGQANEAASVAGTGTGGGISRSKVEQRGDRVELSAGLGSLSRALSAYGEDRAGRVQELAAQYRAGSYQPDAVRTGRAMLAEAVSAASE
jgi:hypothetical protein